MDPAAARRLFPATQASQAGKVAARGELRHGRRTAADSPAEAAGVGEAAAQDRGGEPGG